MNETERALKVLEALTLEYPASRALLDYTDSFELLIGVILSAQTTDRQVNSVTKELFSRFPDAEALAGADPAEVENIIRPVGFYRSKAGKITGTARMLLSDYGGKVPDTIEELVKLPGVGRKSANVVTGLWFGKPAVIVDTHFMRVTMRLGFVSEKDPERIETAIRALLPSGACTDFSMRINYHGRYCCQARKPACGRCPVRQYCRFVSME